MNPTKPQQPKQYNFHSNASFQSFDQYRLSKQDQSSLHSISHPQDINKKVRALVIGCIKRHNSSLYKGQKYFIQDLQIILQNYPQHAPSLMKQQSLTLNKSLTKVLVQCHNCASYAEVYKYCQTCQHIHYCQQACEMKNKFTHQRDQCRLKPFPKTYKALQVEIHVGSDLGRNVLLNFQHQVSMSLLVRGQKLLTRIMQHFLSAQGSAQLDDYKVKHQNKTLKFQKDIKDPPIGSQNISIQKIQDLVNIYTDNKILRLLQLLLVSDGAILWKIIRQIHDNHFREVFIFHYP